MLSSPCTFILFTFCKNQVKSLILLLRTMISKLKERKKEKEELLLMRVHSKQIFQTPSIHPFHLTKSLNVFQMKRDVN